MTAGDNKIIVEKGADYLIEVQVTEGIGTPKDLRGELPTGASLLGSGIAADRDGSSPATNDYWYVTNGVDANIIEVSKYNGTSWVNADADLTAWTGHFKLMYEDAGVVSTVGTYTDGFEITDGVNGDFKILIDKLVTDIWETRVVEGNVFSTEYRYFYHIEINNVETGEDLRVLRGKCAVRV